MCGEKRTSGSGSQRSEGSPPRVRGKETQTAIRVIAGGITPACAGKSFSAVRWQPSHGDHPRVCGEKYSLACCFWPASGSPPRVRGKEDTAGSLDAVRGITPACAGKRLSSTCTVCMDKDHPRVCGEKQILTYARMGNAGSPPRVRGKVGWSAERSGPEGITPACAGKRLKRSHSIGHFSCILCLFHSVLHRASVSGGSRAGPCAPPCLPAQNAVPV